MNLKNILESGNNVQLVINSIDLREYSLSLINEVLSKIEEQGPKEEYLKPKEVSTLLDVDISTLWRWNHTGYLKTLKVGGKVFYRKSDIKKIMEG